MTNAFRLHGTGCGLADFLYARLPFGSPLLAPCLSRVPGDGGMEMGKLVFREDLERFAGRPWEELLRDLEGAAGGGPVFNAGGPALAALTLAAQVLRPVRPFGSPAVPEDSDGPVYPTPSAVPVTFYGLSGDDGAAARIRHLLAQTPLDMSAYRQRPGRTPCTWVFSDPGAADGHGDRCFVHDPGTVSPDAALLGESFYQATVNLYAGTALTPGLHGVLPQLLEKSRRRGALAVVGTVFDFAAEKAGRPWDLGGGEGGTPALELVDLLVGDEEEMCRLARRGDPEEAVDALLARGLPAAVVTRGPGQVYYRSLGGVFGECRGRVPARKELVEKTRDRAAYPGDTTGAGDNFLGGLLASLFFQVLEDDFFPRGETHLVREDLAMRPLRLRRAVELGVAAGGLACLQSGGVALERTPGEKLGRVRAMVDKPQLSGRPW